MIDDQMIRHVSKIAALSEFVENELDAQYETKVGERGVRLSGGQKQRIGIARALYNTPQILIFDEATSALDNITEKLILNNLKELKPEITVVMVAHRLASIRDFDFIYHIDGGQIIETGNYTELQAGSVKFQKMLLGELQ